MKYMTFKKFLREGSAQAAARKNEMISNRVSRSFVNQEQKCSQLTGHAKTACLYGQTEDEPKESK